MNRLSPTSLFVLFLLLITSIGLNAIFMVTPSFPPNQREEQVVPPIQPDEPPVPPAPMEPVEPVVPLPPLVPVDPPQPVLAKKPHEATVKIIHRLGNKTHYGSGLMIKQGNLLLAITSNVTFVNGHGDITVVDTRGRKFAANVVAVDKERCVVALNVADYDHVYTTLKDASFQTREKCYWTFGCKDNVFTGALVYVAFHPLPAKGWSVFDADPEKVLATWFGGPILTPDGTVAGLLLGRAGEKREQVIGINTKEIKRWLEQYR